MISDIDLKELETLFALVQQYQIDRLDLPSGLSIVKKIHLSPLLPTQQEEGFAVNIGSQEDQKDIAFYSSTAPKLSFDDFQPAIDFENT